MAFKLKTSIAVVQALVCLHNFIITRELAGPEDCQQYFPERLMGQFVGENEAAEDDNVDDDFLLNDNEEINVNEPNGINALNENINQHNIQNTLALYFMNQ